MLNFSCNSGIYLLIWTILKNTIPWCFVLFMKNFKFGIQNPKTKWQCTCFINLVIPDDNKNLFIQRDLLNRKRIKTIKNCRQCVIKLQNIWICSFHLSISIIWEDIISWMCHSNRAANEVDFVSITPSNELFCLIKWRLLYASHQLLYIGSVSVC